MKTEWASSPPASDSWRSLRRAARLRCDRVSNRRAAPAVVTAVGSRCTAIRTTSAQSTPSTAMAKTGNAIAEPVDMEGGSCRAGANIRSGPSHDDAFRIEQCRLQWGGVCNRPFGRPPTSASQKLCLKPCRPKPETFLRATAFGSVLARTRIRMPPSALGNSKLLSVSNPYKSLSRTRGRAIE